MMRVRPGGFDRRYTVPLRDMIISGRARPGAVVTDHGPLTGAPDL